MARSRNRFLKVIGNFFKFPGRLVGEVSKLRDSGGGSSTYELDSTQVDYEMAKELYHNERDEYKLGAGFARPIINTTVGFMGVPSFRCEDQEAQAVLDDFFSANVSLQQQTHRDALRDGDCWVWITREEGISEVLYPEVKDGTRTKYNIIPPEMVQEVLRDALTGDPIKFVLKHTYTWNDGDDKYEAEITQTITAEERIIEVEGDMPPGIEVGREPNPWGFIPIVQFINEREAGAQHGRSDLEPIEPFLKAYHDVMLHGMQGSKLHSIPKLHLSLENVGRFLQNNFGIEDPIEFAKQGGRISLEGRDVILTELEEKAGFLEVKSASGDVRVLLKLLFLCIVDTSETPEFAMGAATASSYASVKEQMPVLVRRISRKREFFNESWQMLARIVLAMHSIATGKRFETHETTLIWDAIVERDDKESAETLETLIQGLARAIESDLISQESAVEFISQYVDTMGDWLSDDPETPGEREKIIRGKLLRARLEDAALDDKEIEEIDRLIDDMESGLDEDAA